NLAFGSYDPTAGTDVDNISSLNVTCVNGTNATVGMNAGNTPTGASNATNPQRQLASGANRLRYDLYRDNARTLVWGDTGTANVLQLTGTGSAQAVSVFGR